jgi:hypothetical protein
LRRLRAQNSRRVACQAKRRPLSRLFAVARPSQVRFSPFFASHSSLVFTTAQPERFSDVCRDDWSKNARPGVPLSPPVSSSSPARRWLLSLRSRAAVVERSSSACGKPQLRAVTTLLLLLRTTWQLTHDAGSSQRDDEEEGRLFLSFSSLDHSLPHSNTSQTTQ